MKIKEIEFGITVNLYNHESSKLSIRVEVEKGEDYHQALAQLKEEVISSSGASSHNQARWLEVLAEKDSNKQLQEKADKIREVERLLRIKTDKLEDLTYQLGQTEDKVNEASLLLETLPRFLKSCTLNEAYKIVKSYREIQSTDLTEEFDEESSESPF